MSRSQRIRAEIARINIDGKGAQLMRFNQSDLSNVLQLRPLSPEFTIINRYKLVIDQIQRLMPDEERQIQRQDVLKFSERFFNLIDADIRVLEDNELVRQEQLKHKNKIANTDRELAFSASQTTLSADEVRTKQQFNDCVALGFTNYHKKVTNLKALYEEIHKLKISTSLDMEIIYDPKAANEEYYLSYHTPLLEVLYRMKKNLTALSQDARHAGNIQFQSRSVNFLANCQNLILQLDSFLLGKSCVFNSLLSFIITSQKQNLQSVIDLCRTHYSTLNNLLEAIEKNFYLMNMFDDELRMINVTQLTTTLEQFFLQGDWRGLDQLTYNLKRQLKDIAVVLKELRSYLCEKNTEYMKEFNHNLLNRKIKMLNDVKSQLEGAEDYMQKLTKLADPSGSFWMMIRKLREQATFTDGRLKNLGQQEVFNLEVFKTVFLRIQQIFAQLHRDQVDLIQDQKEKINPQLKKLFVQDRLSAVNQLINYFYRVQRELIMIYESQKRKSTTQLTTALTNAEITTNNCQNYLIGLELAQERNIRTWERKQEDNVKKWLFQIHKAEGQLTMKQVNYTDPTTVQRKQSALRSLKGLISIFEALLSIFQTQIVPITMENIIKIGANLESDKVQSNISDHQEFEQTIVKYLQTLRNVVSNQSLPPTILRLANERLVVMNQIKITYELLFKIYRQLKRAKIPKQLQKHTVPLMNKQVYEYVALLYKSSKDLHNSSRELSEKTSLIPQTRRFLVDVVEEFITNFELYYHISETELEQYAKVLGLSLDYSRLSDEKIAEFTRAVQAPVGANWLPQLLSVCKTMVDINSQIGGIAQLQNKKLGKINYGNLKDEVKKRTDFYSLATALVKEDSQSQITLTTTYKDNKAEQLRRKILINMAQFPANS